MQKGGAETISHQLCAAWNHLIRQPCSVSHVVLACFFMVRRWAAAGYPATTGSARLPLTAAFHQQPHPHPNPFPPQHKSRSRIHIQLLLPPSQPQSPPKKLFPFPQQHRINRIQIRLLQLQPLSLLLKDPHPPPQLVAARSLIIITSGMFYIISYENGLDLLPGNY